ncbi:hypothetical protein [Okeania sp. SIO3B5]|uniref:hypothetical protein n=1 Tax=Okeania sp. SIO3B5 TaxID=2607811 RepID=UPI0025DC79A3|nr:hypothetical protein [Okeania sp. SIO3B5]
MTNNEKFFSLGRLDMAQVSSPSHKKGGLAMVTPKQALRLVEDNIRIPLGKTVKRWFKLDSFLIPMLSNIQFSDIKELRILPRNRFFYVEFVYQKERETS